MNLGKRSLRFALFGLTPLLGLAGSSLEQAAAAAALAGALGLLLEHRLRQWFDGDSSFFATLAYLASMPLAGPSATLELDRALVFGVACILFVALTASPGPGGSLTTGPWAWARLTAAISMAVGPALANWLTASWKHAGADNLLVALFGSQGILYGAPLWWAGFLGLAALGREKAGLARISLFAVVAGTGSLILRTDQSHVATSGLSWTPFLLPGLAWSFGRLREMSARHPHRVVAAAGALLVLWNVLFMEQYRSRDLPSDDTVSFARVTSQSAALLAGGVGSPTAWPANWLFAWRFETGPEKWDASAGRRLFTSPTSVAATLEFGDDPSPFPVDAPLLLEGFGQRRTCERGHCRDLYDEGRILLPIDNSGAGTFTVTLRARGEGLLQMSLDGMATSVFEMSGSLSDFRMRLPANMVTPGIKVLHLKVPGAGRATLDRLTLERDLGPGSAR